MNLQGDVALRAEAGFGLGPFHDLHAVDPGGDSGLVSASDAGAEFIPLAVIPEGFPLICGHGEGHRRAFGFEHDVVRCFLEAEVANMRLRAQAFTVDAHEIAAAVVVDHGLVALAFFGAAKEQATVRAEVVMHVQGDLEVAELFIGDDQAAIAGEVLLASDGTVHHLPIAAGLVATGAAVAGLRADVPAREVLAIEERDEAFFAGFVGSQGQASEEDESGQE